jgi:hypothetical protein
MAYYLVISLGAEIGSKLHLKKIIKTGIISYSLRSRTP